MSKKSIPESQIRRINETRLFIKNWRVNENMTQRDFSKAAEIHVNTIQKLEAGNNITLLTLFACIDAMDMTIAEFFEDVE